MEVIGFHTYFQIAHSGFDVVGQTLDVFVYRFGFPGKLHFDFRLALVNGAESILRLYVNLALDVFFYGQNLRVKLDFCVVQFFVYGSALAVNLCKCGLDFFWNYY